MSNVYVFVRCMYGRLFLYLMNSKSDVSYTRTYILMRKPCLMFMSLLAASERAEKNPLKIKFPEDIVESYKPIILFKPSPDQFPCCRMSVICQITSYFTSHALLRSGCVHLSHNNLSIQLIQKKLLLYEYPSVPAQIAKKAFILVLWHLLG